MSTADTQLSLLEQLNVTTRTCVSLYTYQEGVVVGCMCSLAKKFSLLIIEYKKYDTKSRFSKHTFSTWLAAQTCCPLGVYILPGFCINMLDLSSLCAPYVDAVRKLVIIVGEGASVTIRDADSYAHQIQVRSLDCIVQERARLYFQHDQDVAHSITIFHRISFYVLREGVLDSVMLISGGLHARYYLEMILLGQNAQGHVRTAYLQSQTQKLMVTSYQDHCAPDTISNFVCNGVLNHESSMQYDGTIIIDQTAVKSNAMQKNKNIVLSSQAHVHTVPTLEIHTHDVRCGHGSAVGQLDEEQLMYLQSRGITQERAQYVLLGGFFADLFGRDVFSNQLIAERIARILEKS